MLEMGRAFRADGRRSIGNDLCHLFDQFYVNSALKIFDSRPYLVNERSRTMFRKGDLFRLMGKNADAEKLLREAYAIRRELEPRDNRPVELLEESDFDALVAFWSR